MFRRIFAFGGIVAASLVFASPAFAHVTVHPDTLTQGASDVGLAFRVPNEEDNSTTSSVDVVFPTDHPLLSVQVKAVPGWTSTVKTTNLTTPIKTDDGNITEVVSQVTWKANSGSEIQAGQYQDFEVAVGTVPSNTASLSFPAVQTYSNGDVVKWIEATPASGASPEHPAPVMKLVSEKTATNAIAPAKQKDNTARTVAMVGVAIGVIALIVALMALVRKRS